MHTLIHPLLRHRYFVPALKALLLLALLALLYYELSTREQLEQIWIVFLQKLEGAHPAWLALALLLMPFNWLTETQKWRLLLQKQEAISLWNALKAILAGVAVSLFTPNRVGAFGGRMLFVQAEHRTKAIAASLLGDFAQVLVLLTAGVAGLLYLLAQRLEYPAVYMQGIGTLVAIGLGLLYLLYFRIREILPFLSKRLSGNLFPGSGLPLLRPLKRFVKAASPLLQFERPELWKVLQWSVLRYAVFATQYYFLLKFFEFKIGLLEGFSGIASLFLIQTSLPLPPISGLVLRGNLAVWVWASQGENELSCLAATFALWIINLILPAFVGTFSLFYVQMGKTIRYENETA